MANIERSGYAKIDLSSKNSFCLTVTGFDKTRRLAVEGQEDFTTGAPKEATSLLRTVMLAHLVAKHFPEVIETNFDVTHTIFLSELYKHYGYGTPTIKKSPEQIEIPDQQKYFNPGNAIEIANAHSGGLDSVYRVLKMLVEGESVMAVHLRNLNPKGNFKEAEASRNQARIFNIPFQEIKLINGTDNTGFDAMKTRDMLLGLMVAIAGQDHGVKKVTIEGDMQTSPQSHFSEYAPAWEFFNKLIASSGLKTNIQGIDAHDIESVGEVIKFEKILNLDILPFVQNCFSASYQIHNNRRKWERETPFLAGKSPEHWCGSCTKCRKMTLGRIYYGDERLSGIPGKEVKFFKEDTKKWMNVYSKNRDLISESFLRHLENI